MALTLDDPRLTAYALDEMNENERATFAEELARPENATAREEVDAIQALATQLTDALRRTESPEPTLDAPRREAVAVAARADANAAHAPPAVVSALTPKEKPRGRAGRRWVACAAAVALVCLTTVLLTNNKAREASRFGADQIRNIFNASADAIGGGDSPGLMDGSARHAENGRDFDGFAESRFEVKALRRALDNIEVADYEVAPNLPAPLDDVRTRKEQLGDMDPATGYAVRVDERGGFSPSIEQYAPVTENEFLSVRGNELSTFAFDVDTASWPLIRRMIQAGRRPPPAAVRIEEMVNYFPYDYAGPAKPDEAFAVHVETAPAPWAPAHTLVKIGVKGKTFANDARPACNLTYLVDVSGSMHSQDRLPLVVTGLKRMAARLDARDRLSIVTYAGGDATVLDSAPGDHRAVIDEALDALRAGGGTNGEGGLRRAYALAKKNFISGAANRVVLCTDGDFNIGITDREELGRFLESQSRDGIFLTALGFGMGNHKDAMLEWLANKGHGFHSYVDSAKEADRAFGEQALGALVTIAKDVKVQVEFNPARVAHYRLIGYEHRLLAKEDFNDDRVDGGDVGAGHTATALYELVPPGVPAPRATTVDPLKYAPPAVEPEAAPAGDSPEWLTVKIRHKTPEGQTSVRHDYPVTVKETVATSPDFRFAAAVAAYGMILRDSRYKGTADVDLVLKLAADGAEGRPDGDVRPEFIDIVRASRALLKP